MEGGWIIKLGLWICKGVDTRLIPKTDHLEGFPEGVLLRRIFGGGCGETFSLEESPPGGRGLGGEEEAGRDVPVTAA